MGPSGFASTPATVHFYELGHYHFTVTLRRDAPLAQRSRLVPQDFAQQRLALVPQGVSPVIDQVYAEFQRQGVPFTAVPADAHYTIDTFNRYVVEDQGLLTFECWDRVLPGTVNRPLEVPLTIPYGLMAPLVFTPAMARLDQVLRRLLAGQSGHGWGA